LTPLRLRLRFPSTRPRWAIAIALAFVCSSRYRAPPLSRETNLVPPWCVSGSRQTRTGDAIASIRAGSTPERPAFKHRHSWRKGAKMKRFIRRAVSSIRQSCYLRKHFKSLPGTDAWLITTEIKYGGMVADVPRNKVSPKDPRTREQLKCGGMIGGDRMLHNGYAKKYGSSGPRCTAAFQGRRNARSATALEGSRTRNTAFRTQKRESPVFGKGGQAAHGTQPVSPVLTDQSARVGPRRRPPGCSARRGVRGRRTPYFAVFSRQLDARAAAGENACRRWLPTRFPR
jgi:hypothetical protein